jgi:hypothetical protein
MFSFSHSSTPMKNFVTDLTFPHNWQARILPARPLILPPRRFVYPREAEEVERGAMELMVRVNADGLTSGATSPEFLRQEFLATCALGFNDPVVPTGIWSCPNPDELCAVSGGYAYIIDTTSPERFTMISYRPVLEVRPVREMNLLLFVGHHAILAWSADGLAWESEKLSSEGITNVAIDRTIIRGRGWDLLTDKETDFALDLRNGQRFG